VFLPTSATHDIAGSGGSGGEADSQNIDVNKPYEGKVRLQHSYFLATMLNFRSLPHFIFDCVILCLSMMFFFGGMNILVSKGQIENYHQKWRFNLEEWF